MITRAIVEEINPINGKAKVRIPIFHGSSFSTTSTPKNDLPEATICVLPNETPNINIGDVVIVGFEDWDSSRPIILGYLHGASPYITRCGIKLDSVDVSTSAKFPSDTSIGEVTQKEISFLSGLVGNIQNQINQLSATSSDLLDRISALEKNT